MMKRILALIVVMLVMSGIWSAPPAPGSWWQNDLSFTGGSENFGINGNSRIAELPQSILVLRCQFSDVSFDLDPEYPPGNPDPIPHDDEYFHRIMYHLSCYWADASHGSYVIEDDNYTLFPQVFTLSRAMGYYGDDDLSQERISEMLVELLDMADDQIDFSEYDSFIIFHAGAGQEADISGLNTDNIWTTFVSRKTLQAGLDPENDDFPGLIYDDTVLKEFIIVPETERQPDIQPNDPVFGILGVLCHEFGRQIGLPILYDNQSSNGKSAGIGNYGVMGTGLWNAAGYVPPLPIAWCRIYLGWEECLTINAEQEDLQLTYPMNAGSFIPTIYKVEINEDEYFLLENRRQNPDGSIFVNSNGDTLATFTFEIVENQQYYPEGHSYAGQPYFDFMNNTYAGCEWDFYLPGYGEGDALDQDGSGICIWHVDEIVMREKFDLAEEINVPNGVEEHKAIDLEEADGNQGLDLYGFYGDKNCTYRLGNNDYFGYAEHNDLPWFPTAESYYGGIQLEIFDISPAQDVMTFSVAFEWSLDAGYSGTNDLPAAFLDFGDGVERLFYPMPDARLIMWEDDILVKDQQILRDTIPYCWAWLPVTKKILIPAQTGSIASLHLLDKELDTSAQLIFPNYSWAAPPLVISDYGDGDEMIVFALNDLIESEEGKFELFFYNNDLTPAGFQFSGPNITCNLIYDEFVYITTLIYGEHVLWKIHPDTILAEAIAIFTAEYDLEYAAMARQSENGDRKIYYTAADSVIVILKEVQAGFELDKIIDLPYICNSYPSYGDLDNNGNIELIFGGEYGFAAIDDEGTVIKPAIGLTSSADTDICAGVVPIDLDGDGTLEVLGMMSQNRFAIWENINSNNFDMLRYYPVTYGKRSRLFPIIHNSVIYLPADNGRIFRDTGFTFSDNDLPVKYGNLQRTGYIRHDGGDNVFQTTKLFVKNETYIYPNPYSTIFNSVIINGNIVENAIGVRAMLSRSEIVKINIYDIAGNRLRTGEMQVTAYNPGVWLLETASLASGVYIAHLQADNESIVIKFGIEK
jgi:M6 family metalloprotease-like protein